MGIKTKRRIIAFSYHIGIVGTSLAGMKMGEAIRNFDLVYLSLGLLIFHLLSFRAIPLLRWLQQLLIREVVCYNCGTVIDLIGQFRCGCGYMSYRQRHVFSKCAMCGRYYLWINCPVCEISIPL